MNAMYSALGVLNVDHFAVITSDLNAALTDYLSIPGARLLRGPGDDLSQGIYYAFVDLNGMGVIKILSSADDSSPIKGIFSQVGNAYHCFAVQDLTAAKQIAIQKFGAKEIVASQASFAFDGREIVMLSHPVHGLFELLEAYPKGFNSIVHDSNMVMQKPSSAIRDKLLSIYKNVVSETNCPFEQLSMAECEEWDSFKHLLFIMEVEKEFEVSVSASDLPALDSLEKIDTYLTSK
ncbi:hypothetical protein VST7929_02623 [Vibrio stylophorae]|uniref:VOC domain-containing protein n=1 Tax=Vibrio stylophorae TaxID=659351 RepID=A0ABM8ZWG4_9VIBR|nr:hypothetical protein [Vibrio stylophorae]CAH0534673.1 hypothetical protein VST7929_02623 [Vibrio stylophorae]